MNETYANKSRIQCHFNCFARVETFSTMMAMAVVRLFFSMNEPFIHTQCNSKLPVYSMLHICSWLVFRSFGTTMPTHLARIQCGRDMCIILMHIYIYISGLLDLYACVCVCSSVCSCRLYDSAVGTISFRQHKSDTMHFLPQLK